MVGRNLIIMKLLSNPFLHAFASLACVHAFVCMHAYVQRYLKSRVCNELSVTKNILHSIVSLVGAHAKRIMEKNDDVFVCVCVCFLVRGGVGVFGVFGCLCASCHLCSKKNGRRRSCRSMDFRMLFKLLTLLRISLINFDQSPARSLSAAAAADAVATRHIIIVKNYRTSPHLAARVPCGIAPTQCVERNLVRRKFGASTHI